jgi:hypothetical protein
MRHVVDNSDQSSRPKSQATPRGANRAVALTLLLGATACMGRIGESLAPPGSTGSGGGNGAGGSSGVGGDGNSTDGGACVSGATSRRVRRLSEREYLNVVTDLLGPAFASVAGPLLPFEPTVAGFDNQNNALLVSAAMQVSLADAAEKLSQQVDATKLAPCASADTSGCLSAFTKSFARKAFGRTATDVEVQNLLTVAALGTSYANSVQLVVEAVLQSPQMLYTSELGPDVAPSGASVALTQPEIASQLSLLLTGARPDEQLLQAAEAGQLASTSDYAGQVTRLLATPRGKQQLRLFVDGWVDMGPVSAAPKNPVTFPTYTADTAAAMQEEFDAFVDNTVADGQGTLGALMSATSAHIPAALSSIYGTELHAGPGGTQVLDPAHRKGILSLPGLLTFHSADQHSGPIERGLLVRRQLLCQQIPPPPPSVLQQVATHPIDSNDMTRTTRQKYQDHKTQAFCAACHVQFDVIGFGMEEMDGLGRYRTTENGLPVDTSGELHDTDTDGTFNGVVDLSNKLAQSDMFATCFVQQFFRFAEARDPDVPDQCTIEAWAKTFHDTGEHVGTLLTTYVSDPGFATRKEDRQ